MAHMAIYVYLAQLHGGGEEEIYPPARAEEIASCTNAAVRAQKTRVWQGLRAGMLHAYGLDLRQTDLHKTDCGKWVCSACCFSLSHTDEGIAVALSRAPVGIDREELGGNRFTQKLYDRIACPEERAVLGESPSAQTVARLWTAKESCFKQIGGRVFRPEKINTANGQFTSFYADGAVVTVTGRREEIRVFRCDGAVCTEIEADDI